MLIDEIQYAPQVDAAAEGKAKSEIVTEALRRYLWEERFETVRRALARKARRRGLVTEEDVFRAIS